MKYLKLFVDFRANFEQLSEAEIGRLILAMFDYAETEQEPDLKGNERFVWGAARTAIDHTREFAEKQAKNGAMNGKTKKTNESQSEPKKPTKAKKAEKKIKEKKGNENKGNINNIAEQAPLVSMPLNNGTEHNVTETDVNNWKEAYPNIDVLAELKRMVVWLNANPSRRKTAAGINRFIVAWLARAQEAAPKPAEKKHAGKYSEIYEKY